MTNKLNRLVKLILDLDDVALDKLFALRLGVQTEALYLPNGFVNNQQQVSAEP